MGEEHDIVVFAVVVIGAGLDHGIVVTALRSA